MALEDFKTDDSSVSSSDEIHIPRRQTVQATLTGDVRDVQYTLDHFSN